MMANFEFMIIYKGTVKPRWYEKIIKSVEYNLQFNFAENLVREDKEKYILKLPLVCAIELPHELKWCADELIFPIFMDKGCYGVPVGEMPE